MENVIKIISIISLAIIMHGFIKEKVPEFEAVFIIALISLLCLTVFPTIADTVVKISKYFGKSESEQFIMPVIKVLGITTVMKIISDICVDSGAKAIGHVSEIIGVLCALASVAPLISSLVENIGRII